MNYPGWRAYKAYLAIRIHFQPGSAYHFFEKGGGTSATKESYGKRNDKWLFAKIDQMYPEYHDMLRFLAVNFYHNPKVYIRLLTQAPAVAVHDEYLAYEQSLTHNFVKELEGILNQVCGGDMDEFADLFNASTATHPEIFKMMIVGDVTPWFFIIMDQATGFVDALNISDPVMWQPKIESLRKFQPFMTVDWNSIHAALAKRGLM